jgi:hypothetical protein
MSICTWDAIQRQYDKRKDQGKKPHLAKVWNILIGSSVAAVIAPAFYQAAYLIMENAVNTRE